MSPTAKGPRKPRGDHEGGQTNRPQAEHSERQSSRQRRPRSRSRRVDLPPAGPTAHPQVLAKIAGSIADSDFIVFDIETTGGNPERNGITEIFALRWGQGGIKGTFYSMVNPGIPIPPIVRRMTGINNQMVRQAPRIAEVMPGLIEFVGDDVLVSHNTIGDMKFLRHFAKQACDHELANFYLCTHLLVEKLAPETPDKSLKGLAEYFRLATGDLHRAEADAYVTLELFKVLVGRLGSRQIEHVREAIRLQGDLESGMRLGWSVPASALDDLPSGPGVFSLYGHQKQLLFATSASALDREIKKLSTLNQLPRQLLRVALNAYDLKAEPSSSVFAAMQREAALTAEHKLTLDASQWHQRSISAITLTRQGEHITLGIGALGEGVILAYGPLRDRRQAQEFVNLIAESLNLTGTRSQWRLDAETAELLAAFFSGNFAQLQNNLGRAKRSWRLWFRPAERRSLGQRLEKVQTLSKIPMLAKAEPLLDKTGVLLVPGHDRAQWSAHFVVRAQVVHELPLKTQHLGRGLPDPNAEELSSWAADLVRLKQQHLESGPLPARAAAQANATLWWICFGRQETRFIGESELLGHTSNKNP